MRVGVGRWNEVIPARSGTYAESLKIALDTFRMSCDLLVRESSKGNPNDDRRAK